MVQAHVVLAAQPPCGGVDKWLARVVPSKFGVGQRLTSRAATGSHRSLRDAFARKRRARHRIANDDDLGSKIPSRSPSAGTVSSRFSCVFTLLISRLAK